MALNNNSTYSNNTTNESTHRRPTTTIRQEKGYKTEATSNNNRVDISIQNTANAALTSKQSTVSTGYYQDPFLRLFSGASFHPPPKRVRLRSSPMACEPQHQQPIIRRGTHARVCCMDRAISQFLKLTMNRYQQQAKRNYNLPSMTAAAAAQIVVLGAGHDTSYLRFRSGLLLDKSCYLYQHGNNYVEGSSNNNVMVQWYEIDHAAVIDSKQRMLQQAHDLVNNNESNDFFHGNSTGDNIVSTVFSDTEINRQKDNSCYFSMSSASCIINSSSKHQLSEQCVPSSRCHLMPFDLRNDSKQLFLDLVKHCDFDYNVPTLFLMECVMMYFPEESSQNLLREITCRIQTPILILYDAILLDDPFGETMKQNLSRIHVLAESLCNQTTLLSQLQKLVNAGGFTTAVGCDMMNAYDTILRPEQRKWANHCELLDELEEWVLIMKHYCLVVAVKGSVEQDITTETNESGNIISLAKKFCHVMDKTDQTAVLSKAVTSNIPSSLLSSSNNTMAANKNDIMSLSSIFSTMGFVRTKCSIQCK